VFTILSIPAQRPQHRLKDLNLELCYSPLRPSCLTKLSYWTERTGWAACLGTLTSLIYLISLPYPLTYEHAPVLFTRLTTDTYLENGGRNRLVLNKPSLDIICPPLNAHMGSSWETYRSASSILTAARFFSYVAPLVFGILYQQMCLPISRYLHEWACCGLSRKGIGANNLSNPYAARWPRTTWSLLTCLRRWWKYLSLHRILISAQMICNRARSVNLYYICSCPLSGEHSPRTSM